MIAARSTINGEAVEVVKAKRRRSPVDPKAMARIVLIHLKRSGCNSRDVARVVSCLPTNHTSARRALAVVPTYIEPDDDDD